MPVKKTSIKFRLFSFLKSFFRIPLELTLTFVIEIYKTEQIGLIAFN